jgi:iodotyrosine deiodinase
MIDSPSVPLSGYQQLDPEEMQRRAAAFHAELRRRRSVRAFSSRPVPRAVIEDCLRAAGTAPSGANMQPWHFVAVSDPAIKRQIRESAEEAERVFYKGRAPEAWLDALAPLGTDAHKPFLEDAPYLIAIFGQPYHLDEHGTRVPHYYVMRSVGIATGILIAALHHSGLAMLTYTPSSMHFLNELLGRPAYERPFLILVVGYPAPRATVPQVTKKPLEDIATFT